jgi:hypothetical protein
MVTPGQVLDFYIFHDIFLTFEVELPSSNRYQKYRYSTPASCRSSTTKQCIVLYALQEQGIPALIHAQHGFDDSKVQCSCNWQALVISSKASLRNPRNRVNITNPMLTHNVLGRPVNQQDSNTKGYGAPDGLINHPPRIFSPCIMRRSHAAPFP